MPNQNDKRQNQKKKNDQRKGGETSRDWSEETGMENPTTGTGEDNE